MKAVKDKLSATSIKLDSKEKYTRLFSTKTANALSLRSGRVVLKKSENIGEHDTGSSEEILIILEGKGELLINGHEKIIFGKETALYIPPNTIHDVKNTGRGPLRYVFATCPALKSE
jgi:mannose-6-phosphate isomerase-like protein (cupin superfamily)